MDVIVKEVKTRKDLGKFVQFASKLYKDNPCWVPFPYQAEMRLLDKDRNPSFEYCEVKYFLAFKEDKVVGRVAAILNHAHIAKEGRKYLRFGWLEFIDDPEVSAALIETVQKWALEKGMTAIHGPLGFTDFDRNGFLVEGFNETGTMMANCSQPYYPRHLEALGFGKEFDWLEYLIQVPDKLDQDFIKRVDQILKNNHLHILNVKNKRALLPYKDQIFGMVNEVYGNKPGSVPLSNKQIQVYMDFFYPLSDHKFIAVILNEKDEVAAFSISYPSLSKALQSRWNRFQLKDYFSIIKSIMVNDRAELLLHGVKEEYAGIGIAAVIMTAMVQYFHEFGIKTVESNPELENDQNVQIQWRVFDKRQHKRRRCYIKEFSGS